MKKTKEDIDYRDHRNNANNGKPTDPYLCQEECCVWKRKFLPPEREYGIPKSTNIECECHCHCDTNKIYDIHIAQGELCKRPYCPHCKPINIEECKHDENYFKYASIGCINCTNKLKILFENKEPTNIEKLEERVKKLEELQKVVFPVYPYNNTPFQLDSECLHNGCRHDINPVCNLYCPHCSPRG